jgi:hypothetical protein
MRGDILNIDDDGNVTSVTTAADVARAEQRGLWQLLGAYNRQFRQAHVEAAPAPQVEAEPEPEPARWEAFEDLDVDGTNVAGFWF